VAHQTKDEWSGQRSRAHLPRCFMKVTQPCPRSSPTTSASAAFRAVALVAAQLRSLFIRARGAADRTYGDHHAKTSPVVIVFALVGALTVSADPSYAQRNRAPINPDRIIREQAQPLTPPILNGAPINPSQVLGDQALRIGSPAPMG
jgi:hypothetical protein